MKNDITKLRIMKIVLLLFIIMNTVFAVQNIGMYGDKSVIIGDSYVLKMPQTLSSPAIIDNNYKVNLLPTITVDSKRLGTNPSLDQSIISGNKDKYTLRVSYEQENIQVNERIEIKSDRIESIVSIKNIGNEEAEVEILYNTNADDGSYIFPSVYSKKDNNYFIISKKSLEGNSLAVSSDYGISANEISYMTNTTVYSFERSAKLKKAQYMDIRIVYYPFYLGKETQREYPEKIAEFTNEPLIEMSGSYDKTISNSDKISSILKKLESVKKKTGGKFQLLSAINFANDKDSLGTSAYFKKICIENNIPCKIEVGEMNDEFYAWIIAYEGKWQYVDTFEGIVKKPGGYERIYLEPEKQNIFFDTANVDKSIYDKTKYMAGFAFAKMPIYIILIVALFVLMITYLAFKPELAKKLILRITKNTITKEETAGKYEILKYKIPDKFLNDVLNCIISENGEVDLDKIAKKIKYSRELIEFAVSYLNESGYIKRTWKTAVEVQAENEKVEKRNKSKWFDDFKLKIKESMKEFSNLRNAKKEFITITIIILTIAILAAIWFLL